MLFKTSKNKLWSPSTAPYYKAAGGGGGSEILPSALTGLIGWFKADTGVTHTGNNTAATLWADQSGGGNNVGTAGGGRDPKFFTAGFNGQPSITFTGPSGTILQSAATFPLGNSNKVSVFLVGQMLTGTTSFGRVISYAKTGGSNDFDNIGSASLLIRDSTNNGISAYANSVQQTTAPISLATNYRLGMIFDGTNITAYVNGVATGTPSAYAQNFATGGVLSLGRDLNGSVTTGWSGAVAEVVIAESDCTSQVTGLDLYFKNKWGL